MATFTVTNTNDSGAGSLRQAILAANAATGSDRIVFAPDFDGGPEDLIRLTSGQIAITDALTIVGGPAGVTITGDALGDDATSPGGITDVLASGAGRLDDNGRIFDTTAGLTLEGLTLTGGRTTADNEDGGALRATGDVELVLTDCTLAGNSTAGYASSGGAVSSDGDLTITRSVVAANQTGGDFSRGGGVYASGVFVETSIVEGNSTAGVFSSGGGIKSSGATITQSTISGNHTRGADARGGGLSASDAILTYSTVSGNYTAGDQADGGGISADNNVVLTNGTLHGNETRGGSARGGGVYLSGFELDAFNVTVTGNRTVGYGGGAGGIYALGFYGLGTVNLTNSIVTGNATSEPPDVYGSDVYVGTSLVKDGGNILGSEVFDGEIKVGDAASPAVFATVTQIAPGVFAGDLGDNGGPTQTVALRLDPANPAIGAADPATAPATDQRGVPRDTDPDLGAFEAGPIGGLTIVGGPKSDPLNGTPFDDRIFGRGGDDRLKGLAGDDLLKGEAGCDRLKGGIGDDTLIGGTGRDRLYGEAGNDRMEGGAGRDRLIGGKGNDYLLGGGDADTFVFSASFGRDKIGDLDANPRCGQDWIDLRGLGITRGNFDDRVDIVDLGGNTRVVVDDRSSIVCKGVSGDGANTVDLSDFLSLC